MHTECRLISVHYSGPMLRLIHGTGDTWCKKPLTASPWTHMIDNPLHFTDITSPPISIIIPRKQKKLQVAHIERQCTVYV